MSGEEEKGHTSRGVEKSEDLTHIICLTTNEGETGSAETNEPSRENVGKCARLLLSSLNPEPLSPPQESLLCSPSKSPD